MTLRLALSVLVAIVLALPANADENQRVRYDDHAVVTVTPRNAEDVEIIENLPGRMLSEAIRFEGTDFALTPEQIKNLRRSGVPFVERDVDLQRMIDDERARIERAGFERGVSWFEEYKTYDQINAYLFQLEADFPDLVSVEQIGTSLQGRAINAVTITSGDPAGKPALFINCMEHAREWISPMTGMYIIDQLARRDADDPRIQSLLDDLVVYVIPVTNPDGYIYSWNSDRYWRKNRRDNGNGTFGVDLNRNYAAGWGGPGSSGNTDSDIYRDPDPFSEPETRAVRDFVQTHPEIEAHIDFHSFSQLILWPFGYTSSVPGEPDISVLEGLGVGMSDVIQSVSGRFYVPQPAHELYLASGVATDWVYEGAGAFSWTIELRPSSGSFDGFVLPPEQIIPTGEENLEATLLVADAVASGVQFELVDGAPGIASPDGATTVAVEAAPITSASLDPATFTLRARTEGQSSFTDYPGEQAGANLFTATLPDAPCGSAIEYYFTIDDVDGETYSFPRNAPQSFYSSDVIAETIAFSDDLESPGEWTVGAPGDDATTGVWERVDPNGTSSGGQPVQPEDDATPDPGTMCFITGNSFSGASIGENDVDSGATTLTSPVLDALAAEGDALISYSRWFSNSAGSNPGTDEMRIEISNDAGQSWTPLETVDQEAAQWTRRSFRVADYVQPTSQVQVRFVAEDSPLNGGSVVEAGVDDLDLSFLGCPNSLAADLTGDGVVNSEDLAGLLGGWGDCPGPESCDADLDGDGSVNSADLAILLGEWTD